MPAVKGNHYEAAKILQNHLEKYGMNVFDNPHLQGYLGNFGTGQTEKFINPNVAHELDQLKPLPKTFDELQHYDPESSPYAQGPMKGQGPMDEWTDDVGDAFGMPGEGHGLPSIDPSMLPRSEAPAIAHIPQDPAIKEHLEFLANQGLNPEDIDTIQKYTHESIPDISQRYTEAQRKATEMLGLRPGNTVLERRMDSPFDNTRLVRGTTTRREEITPLSELPRTAQINNNTTGWRHPLTFSSVGEPGLPSYAQSYNNKLPVRGTASLGDTQDFDQLLRSNGGVNGYGELEGPLHPFEQKYMDTYNRLKEIHSTGERTFPEAYYERSDAGGHDLFRDPEFQIKRWREKGNKAWDYGEQPDVVATLKTMGLPGFRTSESGTNLALFDPRHRFEMAAYDPSKFDSRNLFASTGAAGAGISALAAMLLQPNDPLQ
jgi:hypothetical protein